MSICIIYSPISPVLPKVLTHVMLNFKLKSVAVVLTIALSGMPCAQAQTIWQGPAEGGLWSDGANWSTGNPPSCDFSSCQTIVIDRPGQVVLGVSTPISVIIGSGGNFSLGSTNFSELVIASGGILNAGNFSIGGNSTSSIGPLGNEGGFGLIVVEGSGEFKSGGNATSNNTRLGDFGIGVMHLHSGGKATIGTNGVGRLRLGHTASGRGIVVIGGGASEGFVDNEVGPVLVNEDGDLDLGGVAWGAAAAAGSLNAGNIYFGEGDGGIVFNHNTAEYEFDTKLISSSIGTGSLHFVAGVTHFSSDTTEFSGRATVYQGATMAFGGDESVFSFGNGSATVDVLGTLATSHDMSEGRSPVRLTIAGNLRLYDDAVLHMGLGQAVEEGAAEGAVGLGDLIIVQGNLVLAGELHISNLGGMGNGTYELFNFTGSATGDFSGIDFLGGDFSGRVQIDNSMNRVLLTIGAELGDILYWVGGDGDWDSSTSNWTNADASVSGAWLNGVAHFRTSQELNIEAGTVTVTEADGVGFTRLEFFNSGFTIASADGAGGLVAMINEDTSTAEISAASNVTATITADISGDASIQKLGGGTVVLAGHNTWAGSTTVSAGILQIGAGGTSGDLPGDVLVQGAETVLAFNRSDRHVHGGVISGDGQLHQIGSGTLVLTGNNAYYGRTQITQGTLQVGDGGASGRLGSGAVSIDPGATLAFNRSDDLTVGNSISGAGDIVQRGAAGSMVTLTGVLENFSGGIRVESGRLAINSHDFEGAMTVAAGGTAEGTGTIGSLVVESGGRVAPGNSIGTLTVAGNLDLLAGSIFEVEADANGDSDRLVVEGTATLAGNVVALGEGTGWRPLTDYLILSADTLVGEFQGAVEENFAFLDASLTHDHRLGVVTLRLVRNDIDFVGAAATPNQAAAGAGLQSLTPAHPMFNRIFDLTESMTLADVQTALAGLSGEVHASTRNTLLDDGRLVRDALLNRHYRHGQGDVRSAVWVQALAHRGERKGSGADTMKRDVAGLLLGANYPVGDSAFTFGWAVGYHTNTDIELQRFGDSAETNNTHVAAVIGYRADEGQGGWGLRAGLAQTWHEVDVDRHVRFASHQERVDTEYDGESLQAFVEVDYPVQFGDSMVAPFVGLSWSRLSTDGFEEADFRSPIGDTVALKAGSQSDDLTTALIGARGQMQWGGLQLEGALGYRRALNGDDPGLRVAFVDGGSSFQIHGAPVARDAMIADLGFVFAVSPSVTLGAAYNGLLSSDAHDHAIQARLTWALQ